MSKNNNSRRGIFITELFISLFVLGILIAVLASTLNGLSRFNLYQLVRQRCVAAAQAQLDSMETTGLAITEEDFTRLWPKLDVTIEQSDGSGQWEGLKLITVKASGMSFNKPVTVELSRYIQIQDSQQEL